MSVEHEKRPREYAREILAQPDRERRRAMLAEVPEHLRDMTRHHCMQPHLLRRAVR